MTALVLTTADPAGGVVYLAEGPDGALVRAVDPLSAAMWPDVASLAAWLDSLPPEQQARLDDPAVQIQAITLDLRGVTVAELAAAVADMRSTPAAAPARPRRKGTTVDTPDLLSPQQEPRT